MNQGVTKPQRTKAVLKLGDNKQQLSVYRASSRLNEKLAEKNLMTNPSIKALKSVLNWEREVAADAAEAAANPYVHLLPAIPFKDLDKLHGMVQRDLDNFSNRITDANNKENENEYWNSSKSILSTIGVTYDLTNKSLDVAQRLAYGKTLLPLESKLISKSIAGLDLAVSISDAMTSKKIMPHDGVDIAEKTVLLGALFFLEASNPIGWVAFGVQTAWFVGDVYYKSQYNESLTEHFFDH